MSDVDGMYGLFCGCGLNRVVGVHVYDWMYELYISVHEAPFLQRNVLS